jgi:serine acetyltransferase
VPVLPGLLHHVAQITGRITIGDPVFVEPGVYIAHGQVVVDGMTSIGSGVVLFPWVTIGLRAGNIQGPIIGHGASIGTGAKVLGVDVHEHVVDTVNSGRVHIEEIDLDGLVSGVVARGNLRA